MAEKDNAADANMMPVVQQAAEYLETHQIYELFSSLMSSLAISRPSDPTQFIIESLTSQDPCKVCVISNDPALSAKAAAVLSSHLKAKVFSFGDDAKQSEVDAQIKNMRSETNFILANYPKNKQQAMSLLDARVIPDRVFLLSHEAMDSLESDEGAHDLIALSNVFKHNARILCGDDKLSDDAAMEKSVLSAYYEQRTSYRNALRPRFAPRIAIIGPPRVGKTKLSFFVRDKLGTHYLSAAHVLAQHLKMHSELGIAAEKVIASGNDVDDELIVRMISGDVSDDADLLANGFVLDHFPKTRAQSESMRRHGLRPNRLIVLSAGDSTAETTDSTEMDGIKKALDCGVIEFDVEKMDWSRIEELAMDFIVQPLPKAQSK